jgi:hypothetical protein
MFRRFLMLVTLVSRRVVRVGFVVTVAIASIDILAKFGQKFLESILKTTL